MEGQGSGVLEAEARPTGVTLQPGEWGAGGCPVPGEERWTGGRTFSRPGHDSLNFGDPA